MKKFVEEVTICQLPEKDDWMKIYKVLDAQGKKRSMSEKEIEGSRELGAVKNLYVEDYKAENGIANIRYTVTDKEVMTAEVTETSEVTEVVEAMKVSELRGRIESIIADLKERGLQNDETGTMREEIQLEMFNHLKAAAGIIFFETRGYAITEEIGKYSE